MTSPAAVDVQEFINSNAFSTFQRSILILCFLVVTIDGFDTASIGFIAPAIKAEWHLSAASLAPLFGAGLFGLMSGALIFGPLADRFGRKPILIFFRGVLRSGQFFCPCFSTGLPMLLVLRFLTGLGLGGAMPSAVTLTSEYCPQGRRSSLVTLMFLRLHRRLRAGRAGCCANAVVHRLARRAVSGWRSALASGTAAGFFKLPESLRFLVEKKGKKRRESGAHRAAYCAGSRQRTGFDDPR
ncbi:MFS transporter [Undibacterium arcticum]